VIELGLDPLTKICKRRPRSVQRWHDHRRSSTVFRIDLRKIQNAGVEVGIELRIVAEDLVREIGAALTELNRRIARLGVCNNFLKVLDRCQLLVISRVPAA
jgi:hypothetical protein